MAIPKYYVLSWSKKSIWYKNTMSLTHWCCGRHIQMLWDVTWRPPHSQRDRKGLRSETWPQRWQNQENRASTLEPSKQENLMKVFIFLLWCFDDDGMLDNSMVWLVRFPNPLAFGSGLGERTPKKVIFQLRRPVVWKRYIVGPKLGTYLEPAVYEISKNHPEN